MKLPAILLAVVLAMPVYTQGNSEGGAVCGAGLYSNAMCCSTAPTGGQDLPIDCQRPETPSSRDSFMEICSADNRTAKCCAVEVTGAVCLCRDPKE